MSDELTPDVADSAEASGIAAPLGERAADSTQPAVSRRAALRVLGMVPFAGTIGARMAWGQQPVAPQQPRQTHEAPNQPAQGPGAPPSARPLPHFFTRSELHSVSVLADDIIPADAHSPGATSVGVPAFIDFHLSVPETSEDARTAVRGGLRWMDVESKRRFGVRYASAAPAKRHEILDDIAWAAKARPEMSQGAAFFARFRDLVAAGFFSSAAGWEDLRYQGNTFNPAWHGCPEAALKKLGVSYSMMDTRVPVQ